MPTPVIKPSLANACYKTWLFNHNSDYCTLRTPTPVVETPNSKKYDTLDTLNALTPVVETGLKVEHQDKNWASHQVCRTCVENLWQWTKQKRKTIGFAVPMVWREQANLVDDCYFWFLVSGFRFSQMLLVLALRAKATSSTQTFHQQFDLYLNLLIFLHLCLLPCLN